jgi:hypothetical protein
MSAVEPRVIWGSLTEYITSTRSDANVTVAEMRVRTIAMQSTKGILARQ